MKHSNLDDVVLSGREEIQKFVERPWNIIERWIRERNFPAVKLDGRWESDAELIVSWRREQIKSSGHQ